MKKLIVLILCLCLLPVYSFADFMFVTIYDMKMEKRNGTVLAVRDAAINWTPGESSTFSSTCPAGYVIDHVTVGSINYPASTSITIAHDDFAAGDLIIRFWYQTAPESPSEPEENSNTNQDGNTNQQNDNAQNQTTDQNNIQDQNNNQNDQSNNVDNNNNNDNQDDQSNNVDNDNQDNQSNNVDNNNQDNLVENSNENNSQENNDQNNNSNDNENDISNDDQNSQDIKNNEDQNSSSNNDNNASNNNDKNISNDSNMPDPSNNDAPTDNTPVDNTPTDKEQTSDNVENNESETKSQNEDAPKEDTQIQNVEIVEYIDLDEDKPLKDTETVVVYEPVVQVEQEPVKEDVANTKIEKTEHQQAENTFINDVKVNNEIIEPSETITNAPDQSSVSIDAATIEPTNTTIIEISEPVQEEAPSVAKSSTGKKAVQYTITVNCINDSGETLLLKTYKIKKNKWALLIAPQFEDYTLAERPECLICGEKDVELTFVYSSSSYTRDVSTDFERHLYSLLNSKGKRTEQFDWIIYNPCNINSF